MKPCPERTIWSSSFSAGSDPILQHTFPRPAAHYGGVIALFRPTRREALSVFALGAAGYPLLEVCWRGRTHASMALAGGLAFLWIFREHAARRPLWARCLRGALGVTGMELAFGLVLNRALRLGRLGLFTPPLESAGADMPRLHGAVVPSLRGSFARLPPAPALLFAPPRVQ